MAASEVGAGAARVGGDGARSAAARASVVSSGMGRETARKGGGGRGGGLVRWASARADGAWTPKTGAGEEDGASLAFSPENAGAAARRGAMGVAGCGPVPEVATPVGGRGSEGVATPTARGQPFSTAPTTPNGKLVKGGGSAGGSASGSPSGSANGSTVRSSIGSPGREGAEREDTTPVSPGREGATSVSISASPAAL
jgi:hypothetical protein